MVDDFKMKSSVSTVFMEKSKLTKQSLLQTQRLKFSSLKSYTRHPHYPEIRLNTVAPRLTNSTLSNSNKSSNGRGTDGAYERLTFDKDFSERSFEEPEVPNQPVYQTGFQPG